MTQPYPKRLIEVDLPIQRISAHARREKSIRHGHISTLHIWWARRPLAACRAVICAALWPDPVDELCPVAFREAAVRIISGFGKRVWPEGINVEGRQLQESASAESSARWEALAAGTLTLDATESADWFMLRQCLLDFIADFANWDNSTVPAYLETARRLTGVAHAALSDANYQLPSFNPEPESSEATAAGSFNPEPESSEATAAGLRLLSHPTTVASEDSGSGLNDWLSTLDAQLATLPRPLVVDPFCGGGSIPLEALRVGADAFASDLNPVPVLLNKVVLEYIPKYGQRLAEEVRKWGAWIKAEAEKELAEFYPKDPDGATPIAYLWARTIRCEGPACGAEVPLIRSLWLAKKANRSVALRLIPNPREKRVDFDILVKQRDGWVSQSDLKSPQSDSVSGKALAAGDRAGAHAEEPAASAVPLREPIKNPTFDGTVKRGSATCPCCGYTTPVTSVRTQLKARRGGSHDARLMAVVIIRPAEPGRSFRLATTADLNAAQRASDEIKRREQAARRSGSELSLVPDERISPNELRRISIPIYGMERWGDLFSPRQTLVLATIGRLVGDEAPRRFASDDHELSAAVASILGLALSRFTDICNALCTWTPSTVQVLHAFTRQAIGMLWDFAEPHVLADAAGNFGVTLGTMLEVIDRACQSNSPVGHVEQSSATKHPLPDDSASAIITDPPYYDAVPYAYLSDFFYVWLRRTLASTHPTLFRDDSVPKDAEIVVDRPHQLSQSNKDIAFYECELQKAFAECRRVLRPDGIATIVFASKTTSSWEAILKAVVDAGWIITASWPIDTERESRLAAQGQARLASSVHLVCRPREDAHGAVTESVGEWRDVLGELPRRIHEWMPRLAAEGVVGADAIFACLGPALEIFSRYRRVEKANGETATLREYLEFVWAAVSTEALALIFQDADAAGLEPDARLTAMWLWTLGGRKDEGRRMKDEEGEDEEAGDDDESASSFRLHPSSFSLEYDAARMLAQGLGVHLEKCQSLVEVKGDKARLLPVAERTQYLFGKDEGGRMKDERKRTKEIKQQTLFAELDEAEAAEAGWSDLKGPAPGNTVLDRVHQTMILFAANRGELLKRFLVEDGIGKDARFWKLADNLNKLYPSGTEERRWIEGVLARKKGLGL